MTMQVGMLGTDGIVLAGDRLNHFTHSQDGHFTSEDGDFTDVMTDDLIPKIITSETLAIAWSGLDLAKEVAMRIIENPAALASPDRNVRIRAIAREVYEASDAGSSPGRKDSELVIASTLDLKHLYSLTMRPGQSDLSERNRVMAGHKANSAAFFLQRYYRRTCVSNLKLLAAHIILSAIQVSRGYLEGLEIVTCTAEGIKSLPTDEIANLTASSEAIDQAAEKALLRAA